MRTLVAAALACSLLVSLSRAQEVAASIRKPVSIAGQELGSALKEFAKQRELYLVFMSSDLGSRKTMGLEGDFTQDEALSKLLEGSGLTFHYIDEKTISIVPLATRPVRSDGNAPLSSSSGSAPERAASIGMPAADSRSPAVLRLAQADVDSSGSSSADGSKDSAGEKLEEVTVTGTRMQLFSSREITSGVLGDKDPLDIPFSVASYSSELAKLQAAYTPAEILKNDPSVQNTGLYVYQNHLVIRGVQARAGGVRRDGLQANDEGDLPIEAFDRLEVVKGVAGFLYGFAEPGGMSGMRYEDFMRREVFLPLGMTHTSVEVPPGLAPYRVVRYDFDRKPIPVVLSCEPGSASIYASVHDLARFGLFFLKSRIAGQARILSDASIDEMWSDPVLDRTGRVRVPAHDEDGYAIGWILASEGGYRTVEHSGSASGVSTNFILVPEKKLGVVMVANADQASLPTTAVLESLLPDWKKADAASRSHAPEAPGFKPTAQLIGTWDGMIRTYEGEQPIKLRVLPSGDVHVRIGGEPHYSNRSTTRQDALLNEVEFKDGVLTGHSLAQIETSDTRRHPHTTSLTLALRGDVLNGVVSAEAVYDGLWLYGLPYWTELRRAAGAVEHD